MLSRSHRIARTVSSQWAYEPSARRRRTVAVDGDSVAPAATAAATAA